MARLGWFPPHRIASREDIDIGSVACDNEVARQWTFFPRDSPSPPPWRPRRAASFACFLPRLTLSPLPAECFGWREGCLRAGALLATRPSCAPPSARVGEASSVTVKQPLWPQGAVILN